MNQNDPWYAAMVPTMFGSLDPQQRQQYGLNMLGNIGAGMLANNTQRPLQAFGGAYLNAQRQGQNDIYQGQIIQNMQENALDKRERRRMDEETRKRRIEWSSLPENANNPIARAYLGGLLPDDQFGTAIGNSLTDKPTYTTENINGDVTVLDEQKRPVRVLGKAGNREQTVPQAAQNDLIKAEGAFNNLTSALDDYEQTVSRTGVAALPGQEKDEVSRKRINIQLQLKELYNLGVLNGPDYMLMQGMLFDPTVNFTEPGSWSNAYDVQGRVTKSVSDLKGMLKTILENKQRAVQTQGGTNAPMPADNTAPPPGVTPEEWQNMTPEEQALFQ